MTTAIVDCSLDVVSENLVVIRRVSLNMEQTPEEVTGLLPHCGIHIKQIEQRYWSGNEDQTRLFIKTGIMSVTRAETIVDIPIWLPRRSFHRHDGRLLIQENGYGFGLPAFLMPLSARTVRRSLKALGIDMIVALGESEETLWPRYGQATITYLDLNPNMLGIEIDQNNEVWFEMHGIVGLPQLSQLPE